MRLKKALLTENHAELYISHLSSSLAFNFEFSVWDVVQRNFLK